MDPCHDMNVVLYDHMLKCELVIVPMQRKNIVLLKKVALLHVCTQPPSISQACKISSTNILGEGGGGHAFHSRVSHIVRLGMIEHDCAKINLNVNF